MVWCVIERSPDLVRAFVFCNTAGSLGMNDDNLTLIFDGSGVEKGEIDVQDLAPALLALGDLVQSANNAINGNQAKISVCVRATAEGSFEVDLALIQFLADTTKSILDFAAANKDGIAAAHELSDLIFKTVFIPLGAVGGGLIALLKFLKGRKPERIEESPTSDDIIIHIGDTFFITNRRTIQLAENLEVRAHARKALASLSKDGIDKISIRRHGKETLEVNKSELRYFDVPEAEEKVQDEERSMTLQIISLSFKEDNKWKVTDGLEPFAVTIEDTDFLNKIANNAVSFSKNDYLVCDVRERQFKSNKGLRKERAIIKVKEHQPAPKQFKLLD